MTAEYEHPSVPVVDITALMNLSAINARIAPLSISADGLAQLGFPHVQQIKASKLYRECDLPSICQAMARHLQTAAHGVTA